MCDDISLTLDHNQLVDFQPRCQLGQDWFQAHLRPATSSARLSGESVEMQDAIVCAADILRHSDYPLVYGLSRSATPAQRVAVALGEYLGGVVDTTASLCHGPSIMALQEIGEVTCTLGEIRNHADLVIFWGCNPADSHPRHAERYSVIAKGRYLPRGRDDRKVVMVGSADQINSWHLDHEGTEPDLKIAVDPGKDFELLRLLTGMLHDSPIGDVPDDLQRLMSMMRRCKYGVFFFGLGLAEIGSWGGTKRTGTGHVNVAALLHLVAELNTITRFTARRMRLQGDVSGADNVLCWQTGYPFAVDFSRGYPRYNPGEFTANELLERGDVDAALLIGAETVPYFTPQARQHLEKIPKIILDYPGAAKPLKEEVSFTTAAYGLHASGTAYRMDNVPITLKKLLDTHLPTDDEVLVRLLRELELSPAMTYLGKP